MVCVGLLFHKTEKLRVDCKNAVQAMVATNQTLTLAFNETTATNLLAGTRQSLQSADRRWSSFIPMAVSTRPFRRCVPRTRRRKPIEI